MTTSLSYWTEEQSERCPETQTSTQRGGAPHRAAAASGRESSGVPALAEPRAQHTQHQQLQVRPRHWTHRLLTTTLEALTVTSHGHDGRPQASRTEVQVTQNLRITRKGSNERQCSGQTPAGPRQEGTLTLPLVSAGDHPGAGGRRREAAQAPRAKAPAKPPWLCVLDVGISSKNGGGDQLVKRSPRLRVAHLTQKR